VISPISDFTAGKFKEMIVDEEMNPKKATRVVLCTGKIYYDLLEERSKRKSSETAIIRIEQLHPFPLNQLEKELAKFKNPDIYWVQEEPSNMGYWAYILRTLTEKRFKLISRKASASPATGFNRVHKEEQNRIVKEAIL
jgi:2-oxoglutarate dehydrogenase E1 component